MLQAPSSLSLESGTAESSGFTIAASDGESLNRIPRGVTAVVLGVDDASSPDPIAERLRELGFVSGESVRIVAAGPLGGEPLLVQVGFTRFALRKAEAARVRVLRGTSR